MILEKQTQAKVLQTGQNNESIGMSLDLDSAQVLMQMLSKNLYSDSIGSAVRECASNALDSHRRAGVTKPIVVSLVRNNSNNYEFSVEDFGTGLDHDDVENIISKYGKSTKRNSNTELGMMGLGFKAPLAYCSSFYFTCRKDGRERKYMMYEGEETNTIDLLNETVTDKSNGVKVTIPIKWGDKYDFKNKIKEQLAYFENVYFNVDDIDNNFSIQRTKIFQFSELSSDTALHVCLDDVYYPLDFSKMGISRIDIPVGLRFGLSDGLFPTPNRESLIYSQEAKKVIKSKLTEFANYIANKYNEKIDGENTDMRSILSYYTSTSRYVDMLGSRYDFNNIKEFATVKLNKPKLDGVDVLDLSKLPRHNFGYLCANYKVNCRVENSRMYQVKANEWDSQLKWERMLEEPDMYRRMDNTMKGHKKAYLRESVISRRKTLFFKFKNELTLGGKNSVGHNTYYQILGLENYSKSDWRQVIKDWLYIEELILDNIKDVTNDIVPKDWIDDRKAAIASKSRATKSANGTYKKLQGEVTFKQAEELLRWNSSKNCKFVSNKLSLRDMSKSGKTYIYDSHDNSSNLDRLYHVAKMFHIVLITFSNREIKLIESLDIQNIISYDEFMKGDHVYFRRISTSYLIQKLISKNYSLFNRPQNMKLINSKIYEDIELLNKYCDKNQYRSSNFTPLKEEMLDISMKGNKFDNKIYYIYQKYDKFLKDNEFIAYMFDNYITKDDTVFRKIMCNLFKYHKIRLNIENYLPEIEEETTSED